MTARENVALVTDIAAHPMPPEEALEQVKWELGTTTAVITHNAGIAAMADRVITMRSGQIADVRQNTTKLAPSVLTW